MNKWLKKSAFSVSILSFLCICLPFWESGYPCMKMLGISNVYAQAKEKVSKGTSEKPQNITLDFDNVDIRLVIKFMSDLLGKNFLIDDGVKGNVTIISPKAIPLEEAYKVFESILEVKGFAAIPSGAIIKLVPSRDASSRNIEMRTEQPFLKTGTEDTLVTQLIPIENANVEAIKNVIAPLVSKESKLITYPPTNTIILIETASNIDRLIKIIKEIDIPSEEVTVKVLALKYASPEDISRAVLSALEDQKGQVKPAMSRGRRIVPPEQAIKTKVIPDSRTGSVIIVAEEERMQEILDFIALLDIPTPRGKDNIRVHPLKNSIAEDMAKVLSNILSQQTTQAKKGGTESIPVIQNTIITADKATNSLIITASPQDYEIISRIVDELDVIRPQVLVEALIAEVTFGKSMDVGVEWRAVEGLEKPHEGAYKAFGGTNFGQIESIQSGTIPAGLSVGVTKGTITIGNIEFPNIGAIIRAYQEDKDINILSTPHILATDNEEAKIMVGEEVPYKQSVIIDNQTRDSYIYKDVGISLQLTPHINPDGYVKLDISLKIDKVTPGTPTEAPWTTKREAKTTVMVKDKQTVVIGGLLKDDQFKSFSRVPCVGDLPVLGSLFRYMSKSNDKTNLQVFLAPHIIYTPEDLIALTVNKGISLNMDKVNQKLSTGMGEESSGRRQKKEEEKEKEKEEKKEKQGNE